jgi:hypothetical protein
MSRRAALTRSSNPYLASPTLTTFVSTYNMDNIVREGEQFLEGQENNQGAGQNSAQGNFQDNSTQDQGRQDQGQQQGGGFVKNFEQNAGDAYVNQGIPVQTLLLPLGTNPYLSQRSTNSSARRVCPPHWMGPSMVLSTPR